MHHVKKGMDSRPPTKTVPKRPRSTSDYVFKRNLIIISIVHILLVFSLFCLTYIPGCQKNAESLLAPLDLVVEMPPGVEEGLETSPLMPEPEPEVKKAEQVPEPSPEPVAAQVPAATPKEKAKPTSAKEKTKSVKKESAPKIQVNKKRVRNPYGSRTSTRMPKKLLTADEIRKRLNAGARIGDHTTDVDDETLYLETVRKTFYMAWIQPALAIDGLATKVDIELSPGGNVLGGQIAIGSGNPMMDASVMKAVNAVNRINGLPVWFLKKHRRLRIVFELSGEVK